MCTDAQAVFYVNIIRNITARTDSFFLEENAKINNFCQPNFEVKMFHFHCEWEWMFEKEQIVQLFIKRLILSVKNFKVKNLGKLPTLAYCPDSSLCL